MKALVIYDSFFGNTAQIAKEISSSFGLQKDVRLLQVSNVNLEHLSDLNLLIVGSPTRAFKPTKAITTFLKSIPTKGLQGIKVASFDTRISPVDAESRLYSVLEKRFGYAAEPIFDKLKEKGGEIIVQPEGFLVKGSEGPLKDGELERAKEWADLIMKRVN